MLSEEQKVECEKLIPALEKVLMKPLIELYAFKMSMEDCKEQVVSNIAVIGSLIMKGYLILKHKEE